MGEGERKEDRQAKRNTMIFARGSQGLDSQVGSWSAYFSRLAGATSAYEWANKKLVPLSRGTRAPPFILIQAFSNSFSFPHWEPGAKEGL